VCSRMAANSRARVLPRRSLYTSALWSKCSGDYVENKLYFKCNKRGTINHCNDFSTNLYDLGNRTY
jgi:hypothetical protein